MIIHIPHSSIKTPKGYTFPKDEITKMTDWYIDELFKFEFATQNVIFPYTRLFCDVERFIDDPMEEKGMGICYTKKSDGTSLRNVTAGEKERIINEYYIPHHEKLTNAVENELIRWGKSLIIDAHSFPENPLPYEDDRLRPEICLGTNENTPEWLLEKAFNLFWEKGYNIAVNRPFVGTIVPLPYMGDKRVSSIMIEINRGLYLKGREKTYKFENVKKDIRDVLVKLA